VIKITFAGPKGGEAGKLASKIHSMLQVGGKIVRTYDLNGLKGALPDPLPGGCDVTIVINKDSQP
jgi:hypothetical protein